MAGIAKDAHLLVDDYQYLEPGEHMSLAEYGEFLSARYDELQDVAALYAEMLDTADGAGDGAKARLIQHWEKYVDAASTVHRVKHELRERGKLAGADQYWLDAMGEGKSRVLDDDYDA